MRLVIDHTARFFTVVGAPYLPERHLDSSDSDQTPRAWQRHVPHPAFLPQPVSQGHWLRDDR